MFGQIAPRYDRANTVLSMGLHRRWRRRFVRLAAAPRSGSVLDVATGTGDLAFAFEREVGEGGQVVGVDFSEPMLERARAKAAAAGSRVRFQWGDAMKLDFADASFDLAVVGFGIRNVDEPARCLAEMARVVAPGGRVAVLEFGQPKGLRRRPYAWYSRTVVPRLGGWLTGNRPAYEYLHRTSAAFPSGERFLALMESTRRFSQVRAVPFMGGIAYAYLGVVSA